MQHIRTTWGTRWLALMISVSILSSFVAPVATAAQPSPQPYADWLRNQLRAPAGAAFEEAVAEVEAQKLGSFHAYLTAFVAAYGKHASRGALAEAFTGHSLSPEALLLFLQFRYHRVVGEAVLPPSALTALVMPQAKTPERFLSASASPWRGSGPAVFQAATALFSCSGADPLPLRHLVTAQPLGP